MLVLKGSLLSITEEEQSVGLFQPLCVLRSGDGHSRHCSGWPLPPFTAPQTFPRQSSPLLTGHLTLILETISLRTYFLPKKQFRCRRVALIIQYY